MGRNTGSVRFSIKTPTKSVYTRSKANTPQENLKIVQDFVNSIEENEVKVLAQGISESVRAAKNQTLSVVATFFQRVCARTPLDEYYTWTTREIRSFVDDNGKTETVEFDKLHEHIPDEEQCRYDWKIILGNKTVTSREMKDALGEDIFKTVNDSNSINKIKKYLADAFGNAMLQDAVILNDSKHFNVLEFGGYHSQRYEEGPAKGKWNNNNWNESSEIKEGDLYSHGVENYHSVQAPVGMLRITEMELLNSSSNAEAVSPLSERYKGQSGGRRNVPRDSDLRVFRDMIKQMNKSGKVYIKYGDISRYLDK